MQTQNNNSRQQVDENDGCLSPKELVNRHLQNKDHKITDEEFEQVALDCNDTADAEDNAVITANANNNNVINDREDGNDEEKEEKDTIITPLDVLS